MAGMNNQGDSFGGQFIYWIGGAWVKGEGRKEVKGGSAAGGGSSPNISVGLHQSCDFWETSFLELGQKLDWLYHDVTIVSMELSRPKTDLCRERLPSCCATSEMPSKWAILYHPSSDLGTHTFELEKLHTVKPVLENYHLKVSVRKEHTRVRKRAPSPMFSLSPFIKKLCVPGDTGEPCQRLVNHSEMVENFSLLES